MNILLIEDEPAIADTVVYALESEGYSVDWQNTGELGIKASQQTSPDLVILDVGLPDMNGFDVFRQLRIKSEVPVIFWRKGTFKVSIPTESLSIKVLHWNQPHVSIHLIKAQ